MNAGALAFRIWLTGMLLMLGSAVVGMATTGNMQAQHAVGHVLAWQITIQLAYTVVVGLSVVWHKDFLS